MAEAGRVGDEQDGALGRRCALTEARPMIPPRMGPMQGVQPAAKTTPEQRSSATSSVPPSRAGPRPGAAPAGRDREADLAVQARDVDEPATCRPMHDEHRPADAGAARRRSRAGRSRSARPTPRGRRTRPRTRRRRRGTGSKATRRRAARVRARWCRPCSRRRPARAAGSTARRRRRCPPRKATRMPMLVMSSLTSRPGIRRRTRPCSARPGPRGAWRPTCASSEVGSMSMTFCHWARAVSMSTGSTLRARKPRS